ncbi:MAG: tRNA lysidine(34) synthetase TilS [Eubacteriales bacterium]|nr:tRNA lysidine(34) synthetase TilS [Eubacteriales bacterium]
MKQLVRHTIEQYGMIPDGTRVLCGLSGGADSVSLLLCLHELGYDVCACHLNHGLRGGQADADEAFCRALCAAYDIPFVAEQCDAAAAAEQQRESVETAARALRYDFFARSAQRFHAGRIATAHTADDNLETMLFHLIRGTGAAGLAGIPPVRGNIIRPLIAVERRQVEAYLRSHGQGWRTDATNLEDSCTRNRIRHHVIPALRDIEPQAARHAAQTAQLLRQDNACLDALAQVDGTEVPAEELAAMPEALAARAVRSMLMQAGAPMGEISRRHIDAVRSLARKKRGTVSLPGELRAVRRGGEVRIEQVRQAADEICLTPEKTAQFGAYTVILTRKISDIHSSFKHYPVAYDTINSLRLTVRAWRASDRMTLPDARGARSLKRLYAERGIPPEIRDGLPVLCCGDTIIAAAGIGTDSGFYGNTGIFAVSPAGDGLQRKKEKGI